jgi:opacity protein-like surface antigen
MRLTHLPAALALVAATAVPSAAQTGGPVIEPGTWSATPFLSVTFGGDGDSASLGLGGAAGYDFTDHLSAEAEVSYVFDLMGNVDDADWSLLGVGANMLYHFPLENGMAPYATAGLGFARSARTIGENDNASTEVGFNLGGGIKVPLTDAMSARGDLRYFQFNDAAPSGWRLYGGLAFRLGQ